MPKGKSKSYGRKKGGRKGKHGKRLATEQYVKKQIHKDDETKYFDATTSAGIGLYDTVSTAGTLYELSIPTQGAGDSNRIGDKLELRGLRLRLAFQPGDSVNLLRMIIFQYRGNSTLHTPAINEVIQSIYVGVDSPLAPFTHDYKNQFGILYDKTYALSSAATPLIVINKKIKLKYAKKQVAFTAASTNGSNKLYMILVSDSSAIPHPQVNFISRLFYDDA